MITFTSEAKRVAAPENLTKRWFKLVLQEQTLIPADSYAVCFIRLVFV